MTTPFAQPNCWLEHRVSYGETDAMGVVYYANYLHLFERGRGALIRALGFSYATVEARGFFLPVREASCRYFSPARYDEIIHIRTGLAKRSRASLTFVYEITNADKSAVLARGSTQHALVNGQGRPVRIPDWLHDLFEQHLPDAG